MTAVKSAAGLSLVALGTSIFSFASNLGLGRTPEGLGSLLTIAGPPGHLITKGLGNRVEKTNENKVEWLGLVRSFSRMMCSITINGHNRFERPIQARGRERNEALPWEKPCAFPVIGTVAQE